jgi:hypothetical protein
MVRCEICNKEFPFAWKLRRHLARQKSCYKNPTATNDSSLATNDSKMSIDANIVTRSSPVHIRVSSMKRNVVNITMKFGY